MTKRGRKPRADRVSSKRLSIAITPDEKELLCLWSQQTNMSIVVLARKKINKICKENGWTLVFGECH